MKLQYGGLFLFTLVYFYVWLKHYNEISKEIMKDIAIIPAWSLILKLASCVSDIVIAGAIIYLVLHILILTVFRALSSSSLGHPIDMFSMDIAFGFIFEKRLVKALVVGSVLSIILIASLVCLCKFSHGEHKLHFLIPAKTRQVESHASLVQAALLINLLTISMTVLLSYSLIEFIQK